MKTQSPVSIVEFDPYSPQSSQAGHGYGDRFDVGDGRVFRYAKAGSSALSVGKLGLAPAPKTNHHGMTMAAAAIGAVSITMTLGATASVANEYAEGFLNISVTPGQGQTLKIQDQPATSSGGSQTITVFDPVNVALTTSSRGNLVHNTHNAVVEAASKTRRGAGVPLTL